MWEVYLQPHKFRVHATSPQELLGLEEDDEPGDVPAVDLSVELLVETGSGTLQGIRLGLLGQLVFGSRTAVQVNL